MTGFVLLCANLFLSFLNYYILKAILQYIKGYAEKCKSGSDNQELKK